MSTRKLLLADDSITIQKVVNLTFADEGIEVISAGNGDEAMEKVIEFVPDLVMADVNMPGLSGYQICERIKQDSKFRQMPVILLVGSFEPFDEEEARRVGADDFLTKPFQSIRQLVNKVTVLLEANDRSAAQLYEATANNSFADTLDMDKPDVASAGTDELGDTGMDDEMIQTSAVNSFALDESAKFETKEYSETYEDKKTQPLSVYDLKEFSFVASPENTGASSQNIEEAEETPVFEKNDVFETSAPPENQVSSFQDFQDDDLLEIPFDEEDEPEEPEETALEQNRLVETEFGKEPGEEQEEARDEEVSEPEINTPEEANTLEEDYQAQNEVVVGNLTEPITEEEQLGSFEKAEETPTVSESAGQFSPELIEAVARRVVEMLSDRVVREIAWEVVPPHADLVIKKMVEEKLAEEKFKE